MREGAFHLVSASACASSTVIGTGRTLRLGVNGFSLGVDVSPVRGELVSVGLHQRDDHMNQTTERTMNERFIQLQIMRGFAWRDSQHLYYTMPGW